MQTRAPARVIQPASLPVAWALTLGLVLPGVARAQGAEDAGRVVPLEVHSERHSGAGDVDTLVFQTTIQEPGAAWIQVRFGDADLGEDSYVVMTTPRGQMHWHDRETLEIWSGRSVAFRGDTVELSLHAAPGDEGVFVVVDEALVGPPAETPPPPTICGFIDNRVSTLDNRVGRLFGGGCTAWRITNGAFLTAGHCGNPAFGNVEFNVPDSLPSGAAQPADPEDQYPILAGSQTACSECNGYGLGDDWQVFAVGPNNLTGLLPHEAYGLPLRVTRSSPAVDATIRITGFGIDSGSDNLSSQTSTGPYEGETVVDGGAAIYHRYRADTQDANSGSPIIWNAENVAIGIHTDGGCNATGGENRGTSFELNALENAINGFSGFGAEHVDVGHPLSVFQNGSVFLPWDTIPEAIAAAPDGGVISIVAGTYTAAAGNTFELDRPMTLVAPAGTVYIGE